MRSSFTCMKGVIALLVFVISQYALGAPFSYSWNIKELAASSAGRVELRDRRGKLLKTLDTSQMRYLYAVKNSIEQVSETQTELIIVDGNQPNAFAGKGDGNQNIIGINFAMLDIIGMDVHVAAALIGHELAHIRLKHGEAKKSRTYSVGLMKILGGVALSVLGVPAAQTISNLSFTAIDTKYSRDDEREADYLGAIWSVEAGYEVYGAVRLQEAVHKQSRSRAMPFLSTHPSGSERIATLKSLSRRLSR
ncbi:MAG: M48 family metalloprotease [Proteobacteria bacterium]|nr:M48 family metalloprotease [Pseudomonadota bacterium]